ncbi:MAG: GIY-YIG nuclease family protein [Bacteroidota bacterium]
MFAVYVLQSESCGSFYVGQTEDTAERVQRHNEGRVPATRGKGPWRVVHTEQYATRSEACRRERQIKAQKSREYITRLVGRNQNRGG